MTGMALKKDHSGPPWIHDSDVDRVVSRGSSLSSCTWLSTRRPETAGRCGQLVLLEIRATTPVSVTRPRSTMMRIGGLTRFEKRTKSGSE